MTDKDVRDVRKSIARSLSKNPRSEEKFIAEIHKIVNRDRSGPYVEAFCPGGLTLLDLLLLKLNHMVRTRAPLRVQVRLVTLMEDLVARGAQFSL
jgi:hypothetical protein